MRGPSEQKVQFCTAPDGAKIAYAVTGKGPPLVRAAHYLSHLEFDFESPIWRHWIRELSRYNTYIRYDERGCGLSDQDPPHFSFDAWVSDLETVVDSLGLQKFDLLGVSQGGAVAIAYAAKHPERINRLILYGAYARGWGKRVGPGSPQNAIETRETMERLIELGWGQDNPAFRQVFTSLFVPEGGLEQQKWFNELQRISCSPKNALRFDEVFKGIDVVSLASKVAVPTLIMHARHDGVVPLEEGRLLASQIPEARFVSFEGKNHVLLESEPGWNTFLREFRTFTRAHPDEPPRVSNKKEEVKLPLLEQILPGGLRYGANYLVEFEPQSLWFEVSLTLCAQALREGIRTDYHTFTHPPDDIRRHLGRMGLDLAKLEADGTFGIWDSYAVQTGLLAPGGGAGGLQKIDDSLLMKDWDAGSISAIKGDVPEADKKRLHIDDNTSILVQFNDERSVSEHFRTHTLPFVRRVELAAIHSVAAGLYSDGFYRQWESFCDGVIDFKAKEEGDRIGHYMRLRFARGATHDSSWKRLELVGDGEVKVSIKQQDLTQEIEGERRLAAIMFTDTVGFTAAAQKDEELAIRVQAEQRALMRPFFAKYRGREVKTIGDAFLVEFASALEAVKCSVEVQSALREANLTRPEGSKMLVRVGIHIGDVIHIGPDVAGDAVNVASRLEPLAPPGGVCVSGQVYESVANKVPYRFESLGKPRLKNVSTQIEVYALAGFGQKQVVTSSESDSPKNRIAVLPFTNISQSKADDYFADGLTEELISSVSRAEGLRVIARTSVMKYRGTSKTISEIGKELNVGSILEGSVRKSGEKVRITVQLVDAGKEEPKWSQEYDREIRDIFTIQSDIAKQVAEALRMQVLGQVTGANAIVNPEAYVDYLRGRQAWNRRNHEGLSQAVDLFQRALNSDGKYAKAYTGLADSFATLALLEVSAPNEVYPKAKEAVSRALSLDPGLAEAHSSLGLIRFQYDWDWAGAEEEFREAIRINPSYAPAHHFFADLLKALGRFEEALSEIAKAQELDPLNLAINTGVGHVLYLSGQYDRAIEQYKKAVDLDPTFMATHLWFGRPYLEKGMFAEAISELETAVKLSGESTLALAMLGHGLASAGRKEEASKILEKLQERSKSQYVPSYWIAVIYNGFKDREQVVTWLEKAYEERSSWLVWSNVEPRFAWLKGDPRFDSLMSKMNFPSYSNR